MKKLLITGFEPFGGESINPSWDAVEKLPDEINGYKLTKLRLPVVFSEAAQRVIELSDELLPDVVLCIGQAGGRCTITPELVAINLRHARIPDNNGYKPQDEAIIENGSTAYFSPLPMRKMAEAIKEKGILAQLSYSAGAYVCNDLIYSLLAHFEGTQTRAGFIHVPYATTQKKEPSMELDDMVKGLITAIENID